MSRGGSQSGTGTRHGQSAFRLWGSPGNVLAIRLTVANRMVGPAVIRPVIDDWIRDDATVVPIPVRTTPAYCYLQQNMETTLTLTAKLPARLRRGDRLQSTLRFPGIEREMLPLSLSIAPPPHADDGTIREHRISITLPLSGYREETENREHPFDNKIIYTLLAGLAGMEVIPARWVVAELIVTVCEQGMALARTKKGTMLLERLRKTRFYKNGALAFRGAQITHWVNLSLSISGGLHSVLGGREEKGRILVTWERWLLNLLDTDIETTGNGPEEVILDPRSVKETLDLLGTDSERWFSCFLLGLHTISPRFRSILEWLCGKAPRRRKKPRAKRRAPGNVLREKGSLQR